MSAKLPRRLYALLVAINDYPMPVTPLKGCVNDIQKVAEYLRGEKDFEVRITQLLNSEATKQNIVNTFVSHCQSAGVNDVILFYFSGHGTREEANAIFWATEEDRKLESVVCYDSYTVAEGKATFRLLADKEIRYLISKIAASGAHILTIFDCCHSGGNTRNGFIGKSDENVVERRVIFRERLSQAFPERRWNDFIFSDTISFDDARKNSFASYLPEGPHIQMAACQSDESAYETGGEGVFTKNLLEILKRSEGSLTYFDLQARIQNYLRNQFRQTPKTYVVGDDESSLFLGFLNKAKQTKPLYGNVSYNQSGGWIIDFGSMHGLTTDSTIKVEAPERNTFLIGSVKELFSNHAQLKFERHDREPDRSLSYKGYATDYFSAPLNIFIDTPSGTVHALRDSISSALANRVTFVQSEVEADYAIKENNGNVFISKGETPSVPIVPPLPLTGDNLTTIICNYLLHLSQFEFVKSLQNQNGFLFTSDPIEVLFLQRDDRQQEQPIVVKDGDVRPTFISQLHETPAGSIRIKLKNKTDRKLYCALLYLTFNFGVVVKLLKEVVSGLEPNAEVWALDGSDIALTLEEEVIRYNYRESISTLKLIVSTSDFKQQAVRFEMPSLPSPLPFGTKGLDVLGMQYNPGQIDDWLTRNYNIIITNPDFKVASQSSKPINF